MGLKVASYRRHALGASTPGTHKKHLSRVGQNRISALYMTYDRMYGDSPANYIVCTPCIPINVWFWPTLHLGPQCPPSAKELTLFGIQPQEYRKAFGASVPPLCKRAHPFWHLTPDAHKSIWGLSAPPLQKSSPFLASNPRNTKKHVGPQCTPSAKKLTLFGISPQEYKKAFGASVPSL